MKNKHLLSLGVVALIMVILTIIVTGDRGGKKDTFVRGSYLVQGLDPQRVGRIYLERYGNSVELGKSGGRFVILSKDGYPALGERVNSIFMAMTGIRCDEFVTANRDNHPILGVDDGGENTRIRFFDEAGSKIMGVIVGNTRQDERNLRFYVRLEHDDRVYLSDGIVPYLSTDYGGYISERILEGDRLFYKKLSFSNPRGEFVVERKDNELFVTGPGEEAREASPGIEELFNSIVEMRINDIFGEQQSLDIRFETEIVLHRDDKISYRISLGSRNEQCFAKVEARGDYQEDQIVISKDDSDESLREKEAILIAADMVESFNEQHRRWIYEVDGSLKAYLERSLEEFLNDMLYTSESHDG